MLDKHIGVINIFLELLTEFLKSKNYKFCNALLGHTLKKNNSEMFLIKFLLQEILTKFLYTESDGILRADVQVSVQSNVISFLNSYADLRISEIACNTFLMKAMMELCKHTDFLIREKAILFLSKFMSNKVLHNEQKTQIFTTLASVRINMAPSHKIKDF